METRPSRRKKRRGRKLFSFVLFLAILGGVAYLLRNTAPVQRALHRHEAAAPLPDLPFARPTITSAEYSITLSAVQNGVPNNVTTMVGADYLTNTARTTVDSQVGGAFTTTQEIHTPEFIYHPTADPAAPWTRQPRLPETASAFDAPAFIPIVNDIIDQTLRDSVQPTSSRVSTIGEVEVTLLTYVLDRARVPEIAPAIYARVPWLFDVPNATTLTVEVAYDETGIVRHLAFLVDPPQPGTGSDATWVTSYTMDVTSLNAPVTIIVPFNAVDVPAGTP
ncbi:MAG TPA: hypothetical protein VH761_06060 [Ilumatobacteraceae bacterium]